MIRQLPLLSAVALFALTSIGCGPPDFYELAGTVTKDGKPLPFVQITMMPDAIDSTRPPMTIADKDGKFVMKCGRELGVPPGTYTVVIADPSHDDGGTTPKKSDAFYDDYMYAVERYSADNSDLKYESDAHRSDYELALDTKEYSKPKVPLHDLENTTDEQ